MANLNEPVAKKKIEDLLAKLEMVERMIARKAHLMKRNVDKAAQTQVALNAEKFTRIATGHASRLDPLRARAKRIRATIATLKRNALIAKKMDVDAAVRAAPKILAVALQQAAAAKEQATLANLSPKDSRKRLREMEHEANRKEKVVRQRQQRLTSVGVESDARLANGSRDIEVSGIGREAKAYVSGIASILRSRAERMPSRVEAWDKFDRVCDLACGGLMGSPTLDAPVQSSLNPDPNCNRIEASQQMTMLARHIGLDGWGLLYQVVYMRQSFMELEGKGLGTRQAIGARFTTALDGAAQFWGLSEDWGRVRSEARKILTYFDEEAGGARKRA